MTLTDNLADALNITEAGNSYLKFTTTNSSEAITAGVAVNGTVLRLASVRQLFLKQISVQAQQ